MHDGRIVQQGSFADIVREPRNDFVREFIRSQVISA
jgi:ABC-type proline/glycine betaine transport system ATPase subunit